MSDFTLQLADSTLLDVIEGTLILPQHGLWKARMYLSEDAAPAEGQRAALLVARDDGGAPEVFAGTLGLCRLHEGRVFVELVGAAALLGDAWAVHYAAAPTPVAVLDIVQDLAAAAGVPLAPEVSPELAGLVVARWSRLAGESWAAALDRIAERFGLRWRALADGSVWMGAETWPEAPGAPFLSWEDTEATTLHVVPDDATWRPGTVVLGHRIVRVTYQTSGRGELVYEADEGRLFAELVGRLSRTSPYASTYTAQVIEQREDGSLDVHLVEGPIVDMTRVPFEVGVEGARVVIPPKSFVRIGFEGARPDGAFAFGRWYEPAAKRGVARYGDHGVAGTLMLVGAGALTVTYAPPGGKPATIGTITGAVSGSPVVFAGAVTVNLEQLIDTASEEVFLR